MTQLYVHQREAILKPHPACIMYTGLIPGLHPANERCRYKVTLSLIGWVQT